MDASFVDKKLHLEFGKQEYRFWYKGRIIDSLILTADDLTDLHVTDLHRRVSKWKKDIQDRIESGEYDKETSDQGIPKP